jgi:hypothetical protein
LERTLLPSLTTAAEVSSHDDSMAKSSIKIERAQTTCPLFTPFF